jgi:hypothetical protein
MTSQAESGKLFIEITDKAVDTVTTTAHQAKDSLSTTADKAVNIVTARVSDVLNSITATTQQAKASVGESIEQTKTSLEQTLQTAGNINSRTSEAIQTAIASSVNDWLQDHPTVLRLMQVLIWATNHPIISLIILLFAAAIAWSLIKSIGRLFEIAWLSLLQAPFKLGRVLIQAGSRSLARFGSLPINHLVGAKNTVIPVVSPNTETTPKNKQQRLAEISSRLEAIKHEQSELLQEAAAIINSNKIDL